MQNWMTKRKIGLRSLLVAGALTGASMQASCATYAFYEEPTGDTAILRMDIDPDFKGISAISQDFWIASSDRGTDAVMVSPSLTRNTFLTTRTLSTEKKIVAGQRIYISATSGYAAGGTQYTSLTSYCTGNISFVPQVGHTYVAMHRATSCKLDLVDAQTGAAPPDARPYVRQAA